MRNPEVWADEISQFPSLLAFAGPSAGADALREALYPTAIADTQSFDRSVMLQKQCSEKCSNWPAGQLVRSRRPLAPVLLASVLPPPPCKAEIT